MILKAETPELPAKRNIFLNSFKHTIMLFII